MKIARCIVATSITALSPLAFAASDTWKLAPGSSSWNTSTNWVAGGQPGNSTTTGSNTDIATFNNNSSQLTVNLGTSRNLGGMTFDTASAGAYTITTSANQRFFFTRGSTTQMTSSVGASQTISGTMRIGAGISGSNNYTFLNNASSSSRIFTLGPIRNDSGASTTLIFGGSNTGLNSINGTVDETTGGANVLAVTKQGAGTWILEVANTYTGGTTIDAGILGVGSPTALGTGGLTINGGAIAASGATRTLTNNVTVAGNFSFGGLGSAIVLNGTVGLGGSTRSATLAGNSVTLGGVISNGGLTIESASGTRSLTINGAGANTYTGLTTVNGGTVTLAKTGGAIAIAGNLTINTGASAGTVVLGASSQIATTATATVSTGGTLDLATFNQSLTNVVLTGGTITSSTGVLTGLTNNFDLRSGSVSGKLGGTVGLDKSTAGTVTLTGANTFTGTTTVSAGTLEAGAAGALGNTTNLNLTGGTLLLSNTGTTDRINNSATVTMAGGTIAFSGNVSEGSSPGVGALTLSANSFIDFAGGNALINFGASNLASWNGGAFLDIYNWAGSTAGGGNDQLKFGIDSTALTSEQLGQVRFYDGGFGSTVLGTGIFVGSLGEIVPVPEPSSLFASLALIGLVGWREQRRARRGRGVRRHSTAATAP